MKRERAMSFMVSDFTSETHSSGFRRIELPKRQSKEADKQAEMYRKEGIDVKVSLDSCEKSRYGGKVKTF